MCLVEILGQFYDRRPLKAGDFSTVCLCRVFFIRMINFFVLLE